jgi:hypothetical protein
VTGAGVASETWDATWRASLVANLEIMTGELWQVGISEVFADGSFPSAFRQSRRDGKARGIIKLQKGVAS